MHSFFKTHPIGIKTTVFLRRFLNIWFEKDGFGMAAAISFYALFALTPVLAACTYIGGKIMGGQRATESAQQWLESFLTPAEAQSILSFVHIDEKSGIPALIFGAVIFFWIGSMIFERLRFSTNTLLEVKHTTSFSQAIKNGLIGRIRAVVISIFLVILLTIILLAIAFIEAWGIITHHNWLQEIVQNAGIALLVAIISFTVIWWLPARKLGAKGLITAVSVNVITFLIGKIALNLYFDHNDFASAWGAASGLVIVITWFNYNAVTFYLGVTIGGVIDSGLALPEVPDEGSE